MDETEKLDLKPLSIEKETQDKVMTAFNFENPAHMFESAVLVLSSFVQAKEQGCSMMYFYRENEGKGEYYKFDYLKLIEFIKTRPDNTYLHTVKINKYA